MTAALLPCNLFACTSSNTGDSAHNTDDTERITEGVNVTSSLPPPEWLEHGGSAYNYGDQETLQCATGQVAVGFRFALDQYNWGAILTTIWRLSN